MTSLFHSSDKLDRRATRLRLQQWAILITAMASCLPAMAGEAEIISVNGSTTARRAHRLDEGRGGGGSALTNGGFSDGLEAWSSSESGGAGAPGSVAVEEGAAILREGDSFLVTLSQEFQMPAHSTKLSFTVRLEPGFDLSGDSIPDAFEVSLLDAGADSVVASWSDQATSFLNFQENGAVNKGPGVAWDGERATLDVTGVTEGRAVTIFFDLIGADADFASAVRVDDLEVSTEEGFIRGNPNLDGAVNITDPIVILNYLFLGTSTLSCLDAADTNNDGVLNITDPIYLLGYLFLGTDPIPPPYPSCGLDVGPEDNLDCNPCSCPASAGGSDCP